MFGFDVYFSGKLGVETPPIEDIEKRCEALDRLSGLPKMVRGNEVAYFIKGALAGLIP
jgi:hypothetical protein